MARPVFFVIGGLAAVVFGVGVATAVERSGDEAASPEATTTTVVTTTEVTQAPTSLAPTTTASRPTTSRAVAPRPTTATTAPATTAAPATTTTRPALTRAAATQAMCGEIEASVRAVVGGNTIGGGLRLSRAVNTYGDAADPAVVSPARRMLSSALGGDLDASAAATEEAEAACRRLGFPITLPRQPQCVTTPCP